MKKNRKKLYEIKNSKIDFWKQLLEYGFKNYNEYLKTDHWYQKKKEYAESNLLQECVVCGDKKYVLHHLTYERLGKEKLQDFMPVCSDHHTEIHRQVEKRVLRLEKGSLWIAEELIGMGISKYKHRERYIKELINQNIIFENRENFNYSIKDKYPKRNRDKISQFKKDNTNSPRYHS